MVMQGATLDPVLFHSKSSHLETEFSFVCVTTVACNISEPTPRSAVRNAWCGGTCPLTQKCT